MSINNHETSVDVADKLRRQPSNILKLDTVDEDIGPLPPDYRSTWGCVARCCHRTPTAETYTTSPEQWKHYLNEGSLDNDHFKNQIDTLIKLCRNPCARDKTNGTMLWKERTHCHHDDCKTKLLTEGNPSPKEMFKTEKVYDAIKENYKEIFAAANINDDEEFLAWLFDTTGDDAVPRKSFVYHGSEDPKHQEEKWKDRLFGKPTDKYLMNPALMYFQHHGFGVFRNAVLVSVEVVDVASVDVAGSSYTAQLRLVVHWYDEHYDTEELRKKREHVMSLPASTEATYRVTSYCAPIITVQDAMVGEFDNFTTYVCEADLILSDDYPLGVVRATAEGTFTILDKNPIHYFPFDRQELTVHLAMPHSSVDRDRDGKRYFVPYNIAVEDNVPGWVNHASVAHVVSPRSSNKQQQMVCVFRLSRGFMIYMLRVWAVMWMISALTLGQYLIDLGAVHDRCAVSLTLFTAAVFANPAEASLPKVAYLTLLDYFICAMFSFIFAVTFMSFVAAYGLGVPHTTSCPSGDFDADNERHTYCDMRDINGTGSPWLPEAGKWSLENALDFDFYLQIGLFFVGVIIHGVFLCIGYLQVRRTNVYFGPKVEERKGLGGRKADPNRLKKSTSDLASSRKAGDAPAGSSATDESENQIDLEMTFLNAGQGAKARSIANEANRMDVSLRMLLRLDDTASADLLNSIGLIKAKDVAAVLNSLKSQVDVIYLQGSASYLFPLLGLDKTVNAVTKRENRTAKAVTKRELLTKIDERLMAGCSRQADGKKKWEKVSDIANLLFGRVLLNSTATPAIRFFSKRECEGRESTINTQLYYGFSAHVLTTLIEARSGPPSHTTGGDGNGWAGARIYIIDIGASEIKRFEVQKSSANKPIEFLFEDLGFKAEHAKIYNKALEKLMQDLQELHNHLDDKKWPNAAVAERIGESATNDRLHFGFGDDGNADIDVDELMNERPQQVASEPHAQVPVSHEQGPARGNSAPQQKAAKVPKTKREKFEAVASADGNVTETIETVVAAILGKETRFLANCTKKPDAVRIMGGGKTRSLFKGDSKTGYNDGIVQAYALSEINKKIFEYVNEALSPKKNPSIPKWYPSPLPDGFEFVPIPSQFDVLEQAQEAKFENAAAMEALEHAVDLPLRIKKGMASAGNLAWRKGHGQGYVNGFDPHKDNLPPLMFTVGLTDVEKELHDFAKLNRNWKEEPKKKMICLDGYSDVAGAYLRIKELVEKRTPNISVYDTPMEAF